MSERARPRRPAAARHQLACVSVRIEALPPVSEHLVEAGVVFANARVRGGGGKLGVEERPEVGRLPRLLARQPVVDVPGITRFDDEACILQQAEMARDTRLRQRRGCP